MQTARFLFCALAVTLLVGCSNSSTTVAPVNGRITLDGKPLQFAIVTFQPEGKSAASGGTDKDGHYVLMYKRGVMGAPVGMNRVTILLDVEQSHRAQIPSTELQREVKHGENVIDFDLKSDEKQN
jgi:hypothetical protein